PAPNLPPARQPPQGALFDRRNADRRAVGRRREQNAARGERIMHILAGIVLTTIVLLSRAAQDSPSRAEAYEPRGAASVPVEAAAPAETSASVETLSVLTGVVTTRELVRSCASVTCTALDAPTVLETGMTVTLIARDESRAWVQVSGTDGSAWRGWLPLASLRSDGDIGALPAV
ncbi:MAG: hypothetical protein SGJ24_15565, partial [Chloroflexota bacterium]|nr:hypothetical protein [Chloroflexota bacterium]